MSVVIGIDPGLQGAIAVISDDSILLEPMPLNRDGQLDVREIAKIIRDHNDASVAYLEQGAAMPKQGVASMFAFGRSCGLMEGIVVANSIPLVKIRPTVWTKYIHTMVGADMSEPAKKRSLMAFNKLLPGIDARRSARSVKPHDGMIDAALIATFGRRMRAMGVSTPSEAVLMK